jgi:long-chain fatty acid transport protein
MIALAAVCLLAALPAFAYVSVPRLGGLNGSGPTAEMVTSIAINPAAIGRLTGNRFFLDVNGTYFVAKFYRDGDVPGTDHGYGETGTSYLSPVPFLGFTTDFGRNDLTWGAAAYVPFGRNALWPEDGPQRYELTTLDLKGYYLTSALAYRFGRNLIVGGGASLVYFQLDTDRSYDLATLFYDLAADLMGYDFPPGTVPYESPEWEAVVRTRQGGFAFGWNAGVLISPIDWLDVGIAYTSRVSLALTGTFDLELPTTPFNLFGILPLPEGVKSMLNDVADIRTPAHVKGRTKMTTTMPQSVAVGATWHATPRLDFDLAATWTDWSQYEDLTVRFDATNSDLAIPTEHIPTKNVPAWNFSALVRGRPRDILELGLGAQYETDSVPERWASAYNVNARKVDALAYFDWKVTRRVAWGLGYSRVFFFDKVVHGSAVGEAGSARGRYAASVDRLGTHLEVNW